VRLKHQDQGERDPAKESQPKRGGGLSRPPTRMQVQSSTDRQREETGKNFECAEPGGVHPWHQFGVPSLAV
jgi:hypothetical protein